MRRLLLLMFALLMGIFTAYGDGIYNEHDKSKLKAFLVQQSAQAGKTNGEVLGLTSDDMLTWDDNEDWVSKVNTWYSMWTSDQIPKRITYVSFYNRYLAGDLDFSGCEKLFDLECWSNELTSIDVSGCTALEDLRCNDNQLTALYASGCTALKSLVCEQNKLTTLDVSGCTALTGMSCHDNRLTALDVSECTALLGLGCNENRLSALNVSNNTALTGLLCGTNQLSTLDVSNNTSLTNLSCERNQLSTLNITGSTKLEYLTCGGNQLTTLSGVSNNSGLEYLDCSGNLLSTLDISGNTALTTLYCRGNQLTTMDVSHNPKLEVLVCAGTFSTLDLTGNPELSYLECNSELLTDLDISHNLWLEYLSIPSLISLTAGWQSSPPQIFPYIVSSHHSSTTLYVPVGSVPAYKAANEWKEFNTILEIGSTPSPDPDPTPEYVLSVAPLNLSFTALSDTTTFKIESNGGWVISVGAYWLSSSVRAGSGDSTVILVARANPGTIWRSSTVTISDSGHTVTQTIHVTQSGGTFVPTSISLVPSTAALVVGESLTLTATVLPVNAEDRDIFWTSLNSLVATVTGGIVTAISSGSATITATTLVGELSASCYLTVTAPLPEPPEDVGITAEPTLPLGNVGSIELSIPVPVDATFATSFIVSLPVGITLDVVSSALSSDLISDYQLRITPLFEGVWFFEITLKPLPYSVPASTTDAILRAVSARKIVTVSYTTEASLPTGAHSVIISDLSATFSDGTSLEQKEIIVTISTVSTGTSLVPTPPVSVSVSGTLLTVSSPSKESLTVFSVNGSLLLRAEKEKGSTGINIGHLPKGVLIIRGSSGWTRKIIR